jgi:hypothetical protein
VQLAPEAVLVEERVRWRVDGGARQRDGVGLGGADDDDGSLPPDGG